MKEDTIKIAKSRVIMHPFDNIIWRCAIIQRKLKITDKNAVKKNAESKKSTYRNQSKFKKQGSETIRREEITKRTELILLN